MSATASSKPPVWTRSADALWWTARSAKPALIELAGDKSQPRRLRLQAAAAALKSDREAAAAAAKVNGLVPLAAEALSGEYFEQLAAAEVLKGLGPASEPALPALIERLDPSSEDSVAWSKNETVRLTCLEAMRQIGEPAIEAVLVRIAAAEDPNGRLGCRRRIST